ncbi:MAG: hypothetical protein ABSB53_04590 [Nitrososphaerales archaeon]
MAKQRIRKHESSITFSATEAMIYRGSGSDYIPGWNSGQSRPDN